VLGRAVRWWLPARYVGLQHKNAALEQWKRSNPERAAAWKQERGGPAKSTVRVVGHEPCFEVADVGRAVSHYQLLGFTISHHDENYAFAHRDNLTIHLGVRKGGRGRCDRLLREGAGGRPAPLGRVMQTVGRCSWRRRSPRLGIAQ
jgi:hypothetical protein